MASTRNRFARSKRLSSVASAVSPVTAIPESAPALPFGGVGPYFFTCRTFLEANPMFKAIVEKVLLEDEAALGEVAVRRRL